MVESVVHISVEEVRVNHQSFTLKQISIESDSGYENENYMDFSTDNEAIFQKTTMLLICLHKMKRLLMT